MKHADKKKCHRYNCKKSVQTCLDCWALSMKHWMLWNIFKYLFKCRPSTCLCALVSGWSGANVERTIPSQNSTEVHRCLKCKCADGLSAYLPTSSRYSTSVLRDTCASVRTFAAWSWSLRRSMRCLQEIILTVSCNWLKQFRCHYWLRCDIVDVRRDVWSSLPY